MKVACLFSGGKDSTFSLYLAKKSGLSIQSLLTLIPHSEDSYLFHYPNIWITKIQSQVLQIPIITRNINSSSIEEECKELDNLIEKAKNEFDINGIVHGGISSNFQKNKFNNICKKHRLKLISPIWQIDPYNYMNKLLTNNFIIQIIGVSAMGLEANWLGTIITPENLQTLILLSRKYGFNISFEGGEAETLVLDCPIFKKRLEIRKSETRWDGQRGIVEISDIVLLDK
ncbi:MAG TPA: diphthine--ammonia ligase [Nitrososphaeraceae archaeon]|nr:diphthine--ammonia ligase [Nitrososphaeraceae archaeon]